MSFHIVNSYALYAILCICYEVFLKFQILHFYDHLSSLAALFFPVFLNYIWLVGFCGMDRVVLLGFIVHGLFFKNT